MNEFVAEDLNVSTQSTTPLVTSQDSVELFRDDFNVNNIGTKGSRLWNARVGARSGSGQTSYNLASNLVVSGNVLNILFRKGGEPTDPTAFTAGGVISKDKFGYGYYETKVKLYTGSYGFHQSFWMSNPIQDINGFEFDSRLTGYSYLYPSCYNNLLLDPIYQDGEYFTFNYANNPKIPMSGGLGSGNNYKDPTNNSSTPWHVFGYDWTPTGIKMYLNNNYYGQINFTGSQGTNFSTLFSPSQVWLTGVPFKFYPLTDIVTPHDSARMQVGYFAYTAKKYKGYNILGDSSFGLVKPTTNATTNLSSCWSKSAIGTNYDITTGNNNYVIIDGNNKFLEQRSSVDYKANVSQTLSYICNGVYELRAKIRCSTHSIANGFQFIVLDSANNVLASRVIMYPQPNWINISIPNINVTQNKVTILIRSVGKANEWAQVDDISFVSVN